MFEMRDTFQSCKGYVVILSFPESASAFQSWEGHVVIVALSVWLLDLFDFVH